MEFDTGFGNVIVVDNLPVVPKEKFEKLEGVIRKIYGQIGVIKEDGLWMPVDPDTQKTLGYGFIEYNTPQVLFLKTTFLYVMIFLHSYMIVQSECFWANSKRKIVHFYLESRCV